MWRSRRRRIEEIPQASLPDLAFLLLFFFITSMDFVVDQGLPLLLPSGTAAPVRVEPSEVIRIQGLADGSLTLDGKNVALAELGSRIAALNQSRSAANEPEFIVLVETHPDAPYELSIGILDQVRSSASRRVSLRLLEVGP